MLDNFSFSAVVPETVRPGKWAGASTESTTASPLVKNQWRLSMLSARAVKLQAPPTFTVSP